MALRGPRPKIFSGAPLHISIQSSYKPFLFRETKWLYIKQSSLFQNMYLIKRLITQLIKARTNTVGLCDIMWQHMSICHMYRHRDLLFPTCSKFWNNTFEVNVVGQVCFHGQERQVRYTACVGKLLNAADSLLSWAQKTSFSFRVSDGQCQVNSQGSVDVWKCFRYSVFLNASQTSERCNSFCRILFNVANELNELILKYFFFNVTREMCLEFARRFT